MDPSSLSNLTICLFIGLAGGVLGGFLGIGGSLVMIPALAIAFGQHQHLYQAAAMVVNLFVALSAVIRHLRAKVVRFDAFARMAPFAFVFIFVGVWASNQFKGTILSQLFAVFLVYVIFMNMRKIVSQIRSGQFGSPNSTRPGQVGTGANSSNDDQQRRGRVTTTRSVIIGSIMGFMAGLLGIGGGGIAVPLQQVIYRMPLRQCIGTSTAVICITAGFGAIYKNYTLSEVVGPGGEHYSFWEQSFPLFLALIPGAVIGAYLGATLTHKLPTLWVRIAFVLLLFFAGLKMSGLMGG